MKSDVFGPTPGAGLFFIVLLLFGSLVGCSPDTASDSSLRGPVSDGKISVLVAVEPMAWLVEQVGGDRINVDVLVPAGQEPETFSPSPRKAAALAGKEIFFRVGLASEESFLPSLQTVSPRMIVIDLREGLLILHGACSHVADHSEHSDHSVPVEKTAVPVTTTSSTHEHDHEHKHEHDHKHENEHAESGTHAEHAAHQADHECGADGLDPHLWMSPGMTCDMVKRMAEELSRMKPSSRTFFEENTRRLCDQLEELQKRIRTRFDQLKTRTIFVYHPAYGYFCRDFGLEQCAIEMGGRSPKPRDMAAFVARFKESGARSIIVQPEFGQGTIESLTQTMKTQIVVHSPLEKDYFKNLEQLVTLIEQMERKE